MSLLPILLKSKVVEDLTRAPHPSHRHAGPAAPWPWVDSQDEVDPYLLDAELPLNPPTCDHTACGGSCWKAYPQSCFPNWTHQQVVKSKIYNAITKNRPDRPCVCHQVDVDAGGQFLNRKAVTAHYGDENRTWELLIHEKRPDNVRVRAMFIEHMSGPILQMLGAKYNIEPFFWSSSLNWIPSRYQEQVDEVGDRKTYLRKQACGKSSTRMHRSRWSRVGHLQIRLLKNILIKITSDDRLLVLDLLAIHLIRNINGSTIISFHPSFNIPTTTAPFLHERIRYAAQSTYWQNIFQQSSDPTFVLLILLWHAIYSWDEALEDLYTHICFLETGVIIAEEMPLTQEIHVIRAHHLHYASLLEDFAKHIIFIRDTPYPVMHDEVADNLSCRIMARECANLLNELTRLKCELRMQDQRLQNVMGLVSHLYTQQMTAAAVRDSAAMKLLAYLTMIFLPASFIAGIFGMNVSEINPSASGSLSSYASVAISFTFLTVWLIMAFRSKERSILRRLCWPAYLLKNMIRERGTMFSSVV
ncbi:hypothetical protein B0H34DRAFT_722697 [Crassisporium funariophilum]|nr:hypothetical protein B0H34DRAFT_722697 [Crassisporium funariophilum]